MATAATLQKLKEDYPNLWFLFSDREVGPLLLQAVDPNKGFSPTTFNAKLTQTSWWKKRSDSQRQALIIRKTNPGEWRQLRSAYKIRLQQAAQNYGVQLNQGDLKAMVHGGLARGFDPDGPEMMARFYNLIRQGRKTTGSGGARRTFARRAQQVGRADYFYAMSKKNAAVWGDRIARGLETEESMRTAVADKAAAMYPQFATGLKQGKTMAELTDGHRQVIAEELELDPDQIDLSGGRWSKILGVRDSNGKLRPMTYFETLQHARKDPRWWKTSKGKSADSNYARDILAMFGKRQTMGLGGGGG